MKKKPEFKMEPVKSSHIAEIGHVDDPEHPTLRVKFTNGKVYDYQEVPKNIFEKLKGAESIGGFFNARIKNQFKFKKV